MIIVYDVDGTTALDGGRRALIINDTDHPKDYVAYHSKCMEDSPNLPIIELLKLTVDAGHDVRIWTARPDLYTQETILWFEQHIGPERVDKIQFRLRPAHDTRSSNDLKGSWVDEMERPPDLIFDDRAKCVDYFRSRGITVCQVADNT